MNLSKGITFHVSEEAKKAWKEEEKTKKNSCPSCEIEEQKDKKEESKQ
jgi:hypothetical protein